MIEQVLWTLDAERGLLVSAGDDLALIRDEVQRGESVLWRCTGKSYEGFVVTRLETRNDGCLELVIVLGEGRGAKPVIEQIMDCDEDIKSFRVHVKRQGLIKVFERFGFSVDEYVMRCERGR